ncbi:hypothetical protein [Pseudoclavibacter sp. RFBB5]|uniref:hypothetical protein n=1 Tax=Pseudoclavibacter sp. RFBB5 TaxID=2080574 RepID=UPI000CE74B32|nr:hypothetical protein [Pseudoclavibacter sp. RFBB5]PPG33416.1 hypothetical protein C5B97_02050 [Pseudoclavibacter sp. RFBB5]
MPNTTAAGSPSRRALLTTAVWSAPVVAAGVAAPFVAASPRCFRTLTTTGTAYARQSPSQGAFTWSNVYATGDQLRLRVTSSVAAGTGVGTLGTDNLQWTTLGGGQPYGGVPGAQSALRMSIEGTGVTSSVTYAFALEYRATSGGAFAAIPAADLGFSIADLEGATIAGGGSAERAWVSPTPTSGVRRDPSYLEGNGTAASPWSRISTALPVLIDNNLPQGTVDVSYTGPITGWNVTALINASASNPQQAAQSNVWITPLTFTVREPGCG